MGCEIHNALHGVDLEILPADLNYFLEINRKNAEEMDFYGDIIFIHDPQPIALVEKKAEDGKKMALEVPY
jgi:trehalose synthase